MPPAQALERLARSLNAEVLEQLSLASSVGHRGESGRGREEIIRRFLRRVTPQEFEIDTGFVIDGNGETSRQVDIVIHRAANYPVFEIAGVKHFMVEAVVAVIENKADIDSQRILRDAIENICSVKRLDRTGGGRNKRRLGAFTSGDLEPDSHNDQVFGAIVTETGLSRDLVTKVLAEHYSSNPRREWLNMYAALRDFATGFLTDDQPPEFVTNPYRAKILTTSDPSSPTSQPPLIDLAFFLTWFLHTAHYVAVHPDLYLPFSHSHRGAIDLPG